MTDKKKTEELNEAELDRVTGAGNHELREHVAIDYQNVGAGHGGKTRGDLTSNSDGKSNGEVSAQDALLIINELSRNRS